MKPCNKIRRIICAAASTDPQWGYYSLDTDRQVEEAYNKLSEINDDLRSDIEEDLRSGTCETNIPAPSSRHYESKSVAMQCHDGSWVGWTFWYGGGKHGTPREIDWIADAYDLTCVEEEKTVIVRTFTQVEG